MVAVINDTICSLFEFVPLGPPSGGMVGEGFVGWVFEKEVAVVESGSQVIGAARVGIGLCEIDGDKVPTRAEGSRGAVGDEEKSVMRAQEGVVEGTTRG